MIRRFVICRLKRLQKQVARSNILRELNIEYIYMYKFALSYNLCRFIGFSLFVIMHCVNLDSNVMKLVCLDCT